jgi:hypothetical protein
MVVFSLARNDCWIPIFFIIRRMNLGVAIALITLRRMDMKHTNLIQPGGSRALSVLSVGALVVAWGAPAFG